MEVVKQLLTSTAIQCRTPTGDHFLRPVEVELYLHNSEHPDPYVHRDEEQLTNMSWYFHRFKNGTYKAGTFKGLDLTLGDGKSTYCGILIRSIAVTAADGSTSIIEGPCKTVDYILGLYEVKSIQELVGSQAPFSALKNDRHFVIVGVPKWEAPIMAGPRICLSQKYPDYVNAPYRFVTSTGVKKAKKTLQPLPAK